jgi:hypothetical protein
MDKKPTRGSLSQGGLEDFQAVGPDRGVASLYHEHQKTHVCQSQTYPLWAARRQDPSTALALVDLPVVDLKQDERMRKGSKADRRMGSNGRAYLFPLELAFPVSGIVMILVVGVGSGLPVSLRLCVVAVRLTGLWVSLWPRLSKWIRKPRVSASTIWTRYVPLATHLRRGVSVLALLMVMYDDLGSWRRHSLYQLGHHLRRCEHLHAGRIRRHSSDWSYRLTPRHNCRHHAVTTWHPAVSSPIHTRHHPPS